MRKLTLLVLALSVTGTAAAQGGEVIIRRPGQKDQVIRLDSAHTQESIARAEAELRSLSQTLRERMPEMQRQMAPLRIKLDSLAHTRDMAQIQLHSAEVAKNIAALTERAVRGFRMRPIIGVTVDYRPQDTDKYGAHILGVTPGGPAEKAGLRADDIITKIGGKSLAYSGGNDEPLPGVKLVDIASKLTAGKAVEIEYRRGNDTKSVKLTPVEDENVVLAMPSTRAPTAPMMIDRVPMLRADSMMLRMTPQGGVGIFSAPMATGRVGGLASAAPGSMSFYWEVGGPLGNLELAPLNEKLGAYFGTSEGVLVVNTGSPMRVAMITPRANADTAAGVAVAPRAAAGGGGGFGGGAAAGGAVGRGGMGAVRQQPVTFGLEPGDVVLSVDGRKVSSPAQLMKILRTYDKGEEIKLQIMRQKREQTLTAKLP